jgi:hypothetical protein
MLGIVVMIEAGYAKAVSIMAGVIVVVAEVIGITADMMKTIMAGTTRF